MIYVSRNKSRTLCNHGGVLEGWLKGEWGALPSRCPAAHGGVQSVAFRGFSRLLT